MNENKDSKNQGQDKDQQNRTGFGTGTRQERAQKFGEKVAMPAVHAGLIAVKSHADPNQLHAIEKCMNDAELVTNMRGQIAQAMTSGENWQNRTDAAKLAAKAVTHGLKERLAKENVNISQQTEQAIVTAVEPAILAADTEGYGYASEKEKSASSSR